MRMSKASYFIVAVLAGVVTLVAWIASYSKP